MWAGDADVKKTFKDCAGSYQHSLVSAAFAGASPMADQAVNIGSILQMTEVAYAILKGP